MRFIKQVSIDSAESTLNFKKFSKNPFNVGLTVYCHAWNEILDTKFNVRHLTKNNLAKNRFKIVSALEC